MLEGDAEIVPGVELIRAPGHNADMMCVRLTGGGKTVFFTADLIPTAAHVPLPWIMGYDLYPLTTLENKKKWISANGERRMARDFRARSQNPGRVLARTPGKIRS